MSYITRNLRQQVTHWSGPTVDGYGNPTFGTRTVRLGRWEDKHEQFRDSNGNELISNAIVYLDADAAVGDYVYLGASTASDPTSVSGAREVRQFEKTPNLRATEYERKLIL